MSRRRNYGFERNQRAAAKRTRQEAKRERKAERVNDGQVGPEIGDAQDTAPPSDRREWFSASRARVIETAADQRPPSDAPDDWVLLSGPELQPDE